MTGTLDVAVVGAGPAGLATAHALHRAGCAVRVLEAADAVGGRMRTLRVDGCLIDTGAEMIASAAGYPATWRLIAALGLDADPEAVPRVRAALAVWRDGRCRPHVGSPLGLLTGAGLPVRARLDLVRLRRRLARHADLDPDRPERGGLGTATVADLVRGTHPALRGYFIDPFVTGFFGWDPEHAAAAPFAAHLKATGGPHTWHTYRDGMDALTRALAAGLDVVTGHAVTRVRATGDGVLLESAGGDVTARAAVLAVPAPVAARLHPDAPGVERSYLDACRYAPMLRLTLVLDRPMAPRGLGHGFATLVPHDADGLINVITVDHHKHPGRAPAGRGLVSLVTSPRGTAELLDAPDTEVIDRLIARAEPFLPGLSARVTAAHPHRFRYGLPLPTAHALGLRPAFEQRPVGAIDYAGDWTALRPSSEGAIASASRAAARILAYLTSTR